MGTIIKEFEALTQRLQNNPDFLQDPVIRHLCFALRNALINKFAATQPTNVQQQNTQHADVEHEEKGVDFVSKENKEDTFPNDYVLFGTSTAWANEFGLKENTVKSRLKNSLGILALDNEDKRRLLYEESEVRRVCKDIIQRKRTKARKAILSSRKGQKAHVFPYEITDEDFDQAIQRKVMHTEDREIVDSAVAEENQKFAEDFCSLIRSRYTSKQWIYLGTQGKLPRQQFSDDDIKYTAKNIGKCFGIGTVLTFWEYIFLAAKIYGSEDPQVKSAIAIGNEAKNYRQAQVVALRKQQESQLRTQNEDAAMKAKLGNDVVLWKETLLERYPNIEDWIAIIGGKGAAARMNLMGRKIFHTSVKDIAEVFNIQVETPLEAAVLLGCTLYDVDESVIQEKRDRIRPIFASDNEISMQIPDSINRDNFSD